MGIQVNWSWDGTGTAKENMERDREQLAGVQRADFKDETECRIRFYSWKFPAITVGYSQYPKEWVNLFHCYDLGIEVERRPTGGGVVFHNRDLTWSIAGPKETLGVNTIAECYQKIHRAVASGLTRHLGLSLFLANCKEAVSSNQLPSFCFAVPVGYDIMASNRKLVGGAIRWTKKKFLYQGTLSLAREWRLLQQVVLPNRRHWLKSLATTSISLEELGERKWGYQYLIWAILEGFRSELGWDLKEESTREVRYLWAGNRRN